MEVIDLRPRTAQQARAEMFVFDLQRALEEVRVAGRPVSQGYLASLRLRPDRHAIDQFLRGHPDIKRSVHKQKVYYTYKRG